MHLKNLTTDILLYGIVQMLCVNSMGATSTMCSFRFHAYPDIIDYSFLNLKAHQILVVNKVTFHGQNFQLQFLHKNKVPNIQTQCQIRFSPSNFTSIYSFHRE